MQDYIGYACKRQVSVTMHLHNVIQDELSGRTIRPPELEYHVMPLPVVLENVVVRAMPRGDGADVN